jgi:hypothetical protein
VEIGLYYSTQVRRNAFAVINRICPLTSLFVTRSDWNPAVDKQAAARCWRDGQKKRCFTYRFLATGTVEEKIFQRQLSKEGLQSVVDDKEQVNELSTKDLRNLFQLRAGTPSDTHDKLRCERCKIIQDNAELEAMKVLPKKLAACRELVDQMMEHEDAHHFHKPLVSQDHGVSKEAYEKAVKQPMDLGTIKSRLAMSQDQPSSYKSVSSVSKDVNRIFSNVMKVWAPGDDIADAARRLQSWWVEQWTELVPRLMVMKADEELSTNNDDSDQQADALEACATLNNERGEDYQEQIGMPDEENMRSWSHHHTSDTVDDPVFRAAMRGYDSVSFVFGLEVTWSLIQQRQQEEEERQAMKELEAIQELEQTEESAKEEVGGDVQLDDASSDDGDDEVEGANEALTNDLSEQEVGITADVSGESPTTSPQQDSNHSQVQDGTPEAEVVDSSASDDSSMVEILTPSQTDDSSSCADKENETPSPSKNEWECSVCTLFNKKANRKCKACGTRRAKSGTKRNIDELG